MMLGTLAHRIGKPLSIAPDALELLARYPFPGNIRELWNIVERLAVSCRSGRVDVSDLPLEITEAALSHRAPATGHPPLRQLLRRSHGIS